MADDLIRREDAVRSIVKNPSRIAAFTGKAITAIEQLPAADVVEVVHGEWQIIGAYATEFVDAKCSVCGYVDCFDENGIYKFCPDCGAKMDGKK